MGVYAVFFSIFNIFSLLFIVSKRKDSRIEKWKNKTYLFFSGAYLVLIMGLRSETVGTDARNYGNIFRIFGTTPLYAPLNNSNINSMLGYRLLSYLVYKVFNHSYQWMLFICAIIIVYFIFRFIYYTSENYYMSVYLLILLSFYFHSWNITRQYLALAIALNAIIEFKKDNKVLSFVLFAIAASIHNTSVVLVVFILLNSIIWTKMKLIIFFVAGFLSTTLFPYVIKLFVRLFPRYSSYAIELLSGDYAETRGRYIIISLTYIIFLLFALGFAKSKNLKNGFISLYCMFSMLIIEIIIGIAFYDVAIILRVQMHFSIFAISIIPNLMKELNLQKLNILILLIYTIPCYITITGDYSGIRHYLFFWQ